MCTKHPYPDKKTAQTFVNAHAKDLNKQGYLRAYPCLECHGKWHVTKLDKRRNDFYPNPHNNTIKYADKFKKYIE